MSGASENKWRRGAPSSQPSSNANASSGNQPTQQRQGAGALRGGDGKGAWGQNKSRATGSGPQSPRTGPTAGGAVNAINAPPANDAGFGVGEGKEFLKRQYREGTAASGADEKAATYKPVAESGAPKPAWGTRPSTMANSRDFWLEMQKQIKALDEERKKK